MKKIANLQAYRKLKKANVMFKELTDLLKYTNQFIDKIKVQKKYKVVAGMLNSMYTYRGVLESQLLIVKKVIDNNGEEDAKTNNTG